MKKVRELVKEILDKSYLLSLGTQDNGGVWVADVIFVTDKDLNIYWYSETETRHSKAIEKNPQVAGTITLSNTSDQPEKGLQIEGTAEKIEGELPEMAVKHRLKRNKPAPKGNILEPGEAWYCLKPKKIELIYFPLFEFNKKILEF